MKVKAYIGYEIDTNDLDQELLERFSQGPAGFQEDVLAYARESLFDDVYNAVKYNELGFHIQTEVING